MADRLPTRGASRPNIVLIMTDQQRADLLVMDMQGRGQLYDLEADPVELDNLYGRPEWAAVERELLAELLAWTLRVQDPPETTVPCRSIHPAPVPEGSLPRPAASPFSGRIGGSVSQEDPRWV